VYLLYLLRVVNCLTIGQFIYLADTSVQGHLNEDIQSIRGVFGGFLVCSR